MYPTSNVSTEEPCIVQDLEDTTGSWELYGQEDEKRYPSLQAEFFNRAAAPLTRRESLLAFTFVGAHLPRLADAGGLILLLTSPDVWHRRSVCGQCISTADCHHVMPAGGTASLLLWGAKGTKDVALPIQQGPKKGGEKGPRGKI